MRLAVIGAGITGLSAAWLLGQKHEVVLFEAEPRLGGHSNTVTVSAPEGSVPIDTGFIVYNTASYPNLIALFDRLGVATAETSMSFAVSMDGGRYEYCGSGIGGLVGQASNAASPAHWRMIGEIFRFFREASQVRASALSLDVTLGDWLGERGYSQHFIHAHIVPMAAAIWSTPAEEVLGFPFASFARFFENHGLLQAFNRPAWRTVRGGSREYVARIQKAFTGRISSGDPVVSVRPDGDGSRVVTQGGHSERFDGVLLACHADDARRIVGASDARVHELLASFRYAQNEAVLHTDAGHMPRRRRLWSSWNYLSSAHELGSSDRKLSVTYWMNRLQPLETKTDYFVTLNPAPEIPAHHVQGRYSYMHPMFDRAAMQAQLKLWPLQGRNSVWFAGAYLGFGFHEDGLQAGLAAAEDMSLRLGGEVGRVERPWSWDSDKQGRITMTRSQDDAQQKVPA